MAMDRIGRNLARYSETQAMVPPQAPVVPEPAQTEDPMVEEVVAGETGESADSTGLNASA